MKNVKSIITGIAMIFSAAGVSAQDANQSASADKKCGTLYLGVRATPQVSWMMNSDDKKMTGYDGKMKFGASFGVGAGYNFTENMGVALDVLYSMQGKKYSVGTTDVNYNMNYLKIPVLFTYNTKPGKVSFVGKIGPQLGILMSSESKVKTTSEVTVDTKSKYESLNWGGVANAGARFGLTDKLFLDAGVRFDFAFTNAEDKNVVGYPAGRANTYNSTCGIELGLNYAIK